MDLFTLPTLGWGPDRRPEVSPEALAPAGDLFFIRIDLSFVPAAPMGPDRISLSREPGCVQRLIEWVETAVLVLVRISMASTLSILCYMYTVGTFAYQALQCK